MSSYFSTLTKCRHQLKLTALASQGDSLKRLIRNYTRVVQIDDTQVGKESPKIVLRVKNGVHVVVSQDECVERGEHGAELAHLTPVLQIVVCNVQQPQ